VLAGTLVAADNTLGRRQCLLLLLLVMMMIMSAGLRSDVTAWNALEAVRGAMMWSVVWE